MADRPFATVSEHQHERGASLMISVCTDPAGPDPIFLDATLLPGFLARDPSPREVLDAIAHLLNVVYAAAPTGIASLARFPQ